MFYHVKTKAEGVFGVGIISKVLFQVQVPDVGVEVHFAAIAFEAYIEIVITVNKRGVGK
jgi:hypothetical protein